MSSPSDENYHQWQSDGQCMSTDEVLWGGHNVAYAIFCLECIIST